MRDEIARQPFRKQNMHSQEREGASRPSLAEIEALVDIVGRAAPCF